VKNYFTVGQDTDDNMVHARCMLGTYVYMNMTENFFSTVGSRICVRLKVSVNEYRGEGG